MFLGDVPITRYETPGGQKFADTVMPFVQKSNVVILANHGTVSFGETVEKAYWWTEILDAYCRILMLAKDLGRVTYLTKQETKELLDLKQKWGYTDPRLEPGMENCDICANDVFRESWGQTGVSRRRLRRRRPRWGPIRTTPPGRSCRPASTRRRSSRWSPSRSAGSWASRRPERMIDSDEGFAYDAKPGLEPGGALEISPPGRGSVERG